MTRVLWEFSTKSAFWCSPCWWNKQWLFPHSLLTFPHPHAGCWSSVSPSPSGTHGWVTGAGIHSVLIGLVLFIFLLLVPDILCVSYVCYSSRHVDPWTIGIYLYLFNTFMCNFFMIQIYNGSCVQHMCEGVCFLPHIKDMLFPRQWKRWSAALAYSGSWPLHSPPTSLLHCRRLSLACQHKSPAKRNFNQHLLQWAPRFHVWNEMP